MAKERNITLENRLDTALPRTVFDQQRIGQVLNNLLSNALKFTPDNGTVTVTTASHNGQIEVSVHDNGLGVPPEKMALLFSKYGQLGAAVRHEGGTGLGLYISKGIIDSHGGKIWLESKEGQGTTVAFTLPIVSKPQTAATSPAETSKLSPQRVVN